MFNYPVSTCWLIDCALAHNKLLQEVQKLSETEMPYFIWRYSGKIQVLEDIIKTHNSAVMSFIDTLEAHKFQCNKILDHMINSADMKSDKQSWWVKWGAIHKIFNFLFGSGDENSETIRQIKSYLEILEQNQIPLGDELMRQLEMINKSNVQISRNRAVLNMLNRKLLQHNHSMAFVTEGLKA